MCGGDGGGETGKLNNKADVFWSRYDPDMKCLHYVQTPFTYTFLDKHLLLRSYIFDPRFLLREPSTEKIRGEIFILCFYLIWNIYSDKIKLIYIYSKENEKISFWLSLYQWFLFLFSDFSCKENWIKRKIIFYYSLFSYRIHHKRYFSSSYQKMKKWSELTEWKFNLTLS